MTMEHPPDERGSTFNDGQWAVRVSSCSRLSFTLIDLNGEGGRKNGMASMALDDPRFEALVRPARRTSIVTDENSSEYTETIRDFLRQLRDAWDGPPVEVRIERGLPTHQGFGSKTCSLLSLGKAYALICDRRVETDTLAVFAGRAGTSGGNVNLIDRGGFLVDGGHATPEGFASDPRRHLVPSRYAGSGRKPPVLIHSPFPPWPVLMILPAGRHIHGQAEKDFFYETLPIPAAEAHRTAHVVLMGLAPAILEADYAGFCRALNTLTRDTYFKRKQIGVQNDAVHTVLGEARDHGVDAIGMSSMGPVCYAFTAKPREAVAWLEGLRDAGIVRRFWFSRIHNAPLQLARVPVPLKSAKGCVRSRTRR